MAVQTLRGGCHCGKVRFEIETDPSYVSECNCSICRKKGILHHRVSKENFRLLSGESELEEYRFNTGTARHYFCRSCGIHPFTHPRTAPEDYTVNFRCLDDFDLDSPTLERRRFDGQNWEEAVKSHR